MTSTAATENDTNGDEPRCTKCGAGPHPKLPGRCAGAPSHFMRGNQAATVVGQHGAAWRREHDAEIKSMAERLVRDYGYLSLDSAPLSLQIVAIAVARTTKVGDTAYWRMMEIGGPVADSGKERRAYRVWADTNSDLARDLKGVMSEMVKVQPPGQHEQRNKYESLSLDELVALTDSLGTQLRQLKAQSDALRESRGHFTDASQPPTPGAPHASNTPKSDPALSRDPSNSDTRPTSDPALSRNSPLTSAAPLPRRVTRTSAPSPDYPPDSAITSPQSSDGSRPVSAPAEPPEPPAKPPQVDHRECVRILNDIRAKRLLP